MEWDFSVGYNHLRKKNWQSGHFYFIPTLVMSWNDSDTFQSTAITIKWFFIQFGITFTKTFD